MVFCRFHETGMSLTLSHKYQNPKTCARVVRLDANSLYLYCSGQEMPCSKEEYIEMSLKESCEELCDLVMKGELFGFLQVGIHIPDELIAKFSEFCLLFIVDEYQERTGRKTIPGTEKLLKVTEAEKILLYSPLLKWYLSHGLKVIAVHISLKYKPGKSFKWFTEDVSQAR